MMSWDEALLSLFAVVAAGVCIKVLADGNSERTQQNKFRQSLVAKLLPADFANWTSAQSWGPVSDHMVCQYCQTEGVVRSKPVVRTAVARTGLYKTVSRISAIQLHCDKCGMTSTTT